MRKKKLLLQLENIKKQVEDLNKRVEVLMFKNELNDDKFMVYIEAEQSDTDSCLFEAEYLFCKLNICVKYLSNDGKEIIKTVIYRDFNQLVDFRKNGDYIEIYVNLDLYAVYKVNTDIQEVCKFDLECYKEKHKLEIKEWLENKRNENKRFVNRLKR